MSCTVCGVPLFTMEQAQGKCLPCMTKDTVVVESMAVPRIGYGWVPTTPYRIDRLVALLKPVDVATRYISTPPVSAPPSGADGEEPSGPNGGDSAASRPMHVPVLRSLPREPRKVLIQAIDPVTRKAKPGVFTTLVEDMR